MGFNDRQPLAHRFDHDEPEPLVCGREEERVVPAVFLHHAFFRHPVDDRNKRPDGRIERVDESFRSAGALFREFGFAFYLAVTQLEHSEWLTAQGRGNEAQPLLDEARQTFEQLQATPWLERAAQVTPTRREPEAAIS